MKYQVKEFFFMHKVRWIQNNIHKNIKQDKKQ